MPYLPNDTLMQEPSPSVNGGYPPYLAYENLINFYYSLHKLKLMSDSVFTLAKQKVFEKYLW